MEIVKPLKRNIGVQLMGRAARLGIGGVAASVILARYLGQNGFGIYSLAFAFVSFFGPIVDFGTNDIAVREFAKDSASVSRLIRGLIYIRLGTSLFAVGACAAIALILGYPAEQRTAVIVASLSLPLFGLSSLFGSIYRARLRMGYTELASTTASVLYLGLLILAVKMNLSVLAVIWIGLSQHLITLLVSLLFLRKVWDRKEHVFESGGLRRVLFDSVPAGLVIIAIGIYANIDLIMLSKLRGDAAVGLYSAAYKFVLLALTVPTAFVNAFLPIITEVAQKDLRQLKKVCENALNFLISISFPAMAAVSVLSGSIVLLAYGEDFSASGPPLAVLAWGSALMFLSLTVNTILLALNHQSKALLICSTAIVLNAALNLLLIPRHGILGAAWGTLLTEVWIIIPGMWLVRLYTGARPGVMNLLKTALATALIYMGTLNVQPFGLFPASVVSVSMFILIYLLLFGFPLSQFALKLRPDRDGPKRLLFVSPVYKPYIGGVERVIERVSTELSKMRVFDEIGILTTRYDYTKWPPRNVKSLPTEEVIDGVRVFRVNHYLNSFRLFYHFAAGIFSPHAKRIIRKFDPDVIHFTFGDWFIPNLIVYLFTRDRARHVYSVFYHELSADPKFLPMRLVNRFLTANVDYTHVATEHGKRGVAGAYGTPLERVKVIPLGSDLSNRRAENRPQRRTGAFTILSVGRLERLKGQQDLLQAYHALKKEVNRPLRLVLVGGPGNHAAEITRYIGTHRLEDVVETPGPVTENELNGFYQDAHVFALLSRAESFGLVYVEAMAHGLPVVAYDISPVNEVLSRGAIFVQPGDIKGVKSALASLIQDESYRVELGRQGREHTRTHYRWSRTASELNKLYHGSSW